jgi:hypothetical protein
MTLRKGKLIDISGLILFIGSYHCFKNDIKYIDAAC